MVTLDPTVTPLNVPPTLVRPNVVAVALAIVPPVTLPYARYQLPNPDARFRVAPLLFNAPFK